MPPHIGAILVGAGFFGALVCIGLGLYRLAIAGFGLVKRAGNLGRERPLAAQIVATEAQLAAARAAFESLPELYERARDAIFSLLDRRRQLEQAAKGISFAARLARAVWDGPAK
jgi:hypothetical protein